MKEQRDPTIPLGLIALAVAGVVVYLLAEPRLDARTVNKIAYICAMTPIIVGGIVAVFLGLTFRDRARHSAQRQDEALRQEALYQRHQMAQAQSADLAVLRQMTQVVEAGARAQLTAAKAQNELARGAALQAPQDDSAYWVIPAEWAEIE